MLRALQVAFVSKCWQTAQGHRRPPTRHAKTVNMTHPFVGRLRVGWGVLEDLGGGGWRGGEILCAYCTLERIRSSTFGFISTIKCRMCRGTVLSYSASLRHHPLTKRNRDRRFPPPLHTIEVCFLDELTFGNGEGQRPSKRKTNASDT